MLMIAKMSVAKDTQGRQSSALLVDQELINLLWEAQHVMLAQQIPTAKEQVQYVYVMRDTHLKMAHAFNVQQASTRARWEMLNVQTAVRESTPRSQGRFHRACAKTVLQASCLHKEALKRVTV